MKNKLNEELKDIKYLFNYNRGRVISEQERFDDINYDDEEEFVDYDDINYDDEELIEDFETQGDQGMMSDEDWANWGKPTPDEDMDQEYDELDEEMDLPVMLPGTKEKERTITTPGIKPGTKPGTPYKPKPGPKKIGRAHV